MTGEEAVMTRRKESNNTMERTGSQKVISSTDTSQLDLQILPHL